MAIEMKLDRNQNGARLPLDAAYLRVEGVHIATAQRQNQVWIDTLTYGDLEARQAEGAQTLDKVRHMTTLSDFIARGAPTGFTIPEIIAAAYRWLKATGISGRDV